ncbi:hypothetical protein D3C86_1346580 [compost metagenome]
MRGDRFRSQNRELLKDDAHLLVALQDFIHVSHGAFAITAIVIEELDQRDVAIRIAERQIEFRFEDGLLVVGDGFRRLGVTRRILLAFKRILNLEHDFRVLDEILLDELAHFLLLLLIERMGGQGGEYRRKGRHAGEKGGTEKMRHIGPHSVRPEPLEIL